MTVRYLVPEASVLAAAVTSGVFTSTTDGLVPASGGGTSNFLRADGTWAVPPGTGGAGSLAAGSTTLDFGAAPGGQRASITVIGQATIAAGSHVSAFVMGSTTAAHNAYEHAMVPLRVTCGNIVAGVGFDITGVCDWRVAGTFTVHWYWV